jgi:hypothetical protein
MHQEKVSAIASWLPLTNRKQLQRFLRFANYYRRFIKDFSGTARLRSDLTKKTTDWVWSPAFHTTFEQLKTCCSIAPTLRIYDGAKPALVETDVSDWSASGTLLQENEDGELQPVAYFSGKHSAQACNYDLYDKELLAVIKVVEEWRLELEGSS